MLEVIASRVSGLLGRESFLISRLGAPDRPLSDGFRTARQDSLSERGVAHLLCG
jgi:hypothetical protein